ncbi:MAG: hypothetical protein A7316_11175 [Candidatus Altiarchaeales archaeon WOR_SM1_86-2]|nr:MAG: hypothetical protein A7316_11175 [Candidatus Altiarchaeales archaeon WOR_SM1_86-2]
MDEKIKKKKGNFGRKLGAMCFLTFSALVLATVVFGAGPPIHVGSHPNEPVVAPEGEPTCAATLEANKTVGMVTLISMAKSIDGDYPRTVAKFLETTRIVYSQNTPTDTENYDDPYYSEKNDKRNAPSGPDSYSFGVEEYDPDCEYNLYVENHCVHSADIWVGENLLLGPDVFKSTGKKVDDNDFIHLGLTDHITKVDYDAYGCDDLEPCACDTTCAKKGKGCCSACYLMVVNVTEYGEDIENFTVKVQSNPDSYLVFGVTKVCEVHPSIDIVKTATVEPLPERYIITYTYVITNTGDVPLTGIVLTDDDPLGLLGPISCTPAITTTLEPEDDMTCTATMTVYESGPIVETVVTNTAIVTGIEPEGTTVTDEDTATVTIYI